MKCFYNATSARKNGHQFIVQLLAYVTIFFLKIIIIKIIKHTCGFQLNLHSSCVKQC